MIKKLNWFERNKYLWVLVDASWMNITIYDWATIDAVFRRKFQSTTHTTETNKSAKEHICSTIDADRSLRYSFCQWNQRKYTSLRGTFGRRWRLAWWVAHTSHFFFIYNFNLEIGIFHLSINQLTFVYHKNDDTFHKAIHFPHHLRLAYDRWRHFIEHTQYASWTWNTKRWWLILRSNHSTPTKWNLLLTIENQQSKKCLFFWPRVVPSTIATCAVNFGRKKK